MNAAARASGSILIVGHQRRFDSRYALARKLVIDGALGTLEEILAICNGDLFSDGTHAIDLMRFLAGDAPVSWVFGQIDLRQPTVNNTAHVGYQRWRETATRYGHPIEGGSVAQVQFTDGPRGILETGFAARPLGYQRFRVLGSDGRLEISGDPRPEVPQFLRVWPRGAAGWQEVALPPANAFAEEVRALLASIEGGVPHLLNGESGRANVEIAVAIMESAFRHERLTLPTDVTDHPLIRRQTAGVAL
jgi:UDP-N-acetyl-2-amino-2-deoxyglucuronate dehydrogenase